MTVSLTPAPLAAAPFSASAMAPMDLGGYHLIDAEYLPFQGDTPLRYPDDVLWGFYPDGASSAAIACALTSFKELKTFFAAQWPASLKLQQLGGATLFDLWINDYTQASLDHDVRPAGLQHWPPANDYRNGSWKWVSSVTQDGTCLLPDMDQVADTLAAALHDLDGNY